MLWTIFVILVILWLLGLVTSYTMGGFIHILLVVAIVILIFRLRHRTAALMSPLKIVALLLIVGGIVGLVYGGFAYAESTHDAKIGPLEFSIKDEERSTSRSGPAWPPSSSAACCLPRAET